MGKVLVVEDELDIIAVITIILENEGYTVQGMSNVSDFENKILKSQPDLVLLDLNLAGFDGRHICSYIKNSYVLQHIPVVLVSANFDIEQVMHECGADGMVKKPFDINSLVETVETYIYKAAN